MRFVKVRYDGYNGQFNVTERQFGAEPDDEPMYLVDDFTKQDFFSTADLDLLEFDDTLDVWGLVIFVPFCGYFT